MMINYPLKDLVLNIDKNISYNDFDNVINDINDLLFDTDWIAEYDIHSILYKRFLTFRNKINTDKRYDFNISSLQYDNSYIDINNDGFLFSLNNNPISLNGVRIFVYNNINTDFELLLSILKKCLKNANMNIDYYNKNINDTYNSLIGFQKGLDGNYNWVL
jgi:hypothetical protein